MNIALGYIFDIYERMISFMFNSMNLDSITDNPASGMVTFGWIMISIITLGILVKNILAIPHKAQSISNAYRNPYADDINRAFNKKSWK